MESRPYADDDLPRLQAALARWIQAAGTCGYGHVGDLPHRIYTGLRGLYPLGDRVLIWEQGAEVVGVAINCRFDSNFDLFTAPELRGTEQEAAMLQQAYETTHRHVVRLERPDASVGTDVFSCDETRKSLLGRLGFVEYRRWDDVTERALDEPIREGRVADGFAIRSATFDDYAQLAAVRNDAFGDDWSPEQYRDAVMRKPGYQPECELVVIAPDGQIAAFTVVWLDPLNRVGQFEPVGTRPAFQRRGLARALLIAGLHEMQHQGMVRAMVTYDTTNLPARELYRSLGFRTAYETLGYRRG